MSVPVLVVTGFLGSGKTTFINRLLGGDHGLRIAAIVNDFGAINIDAALIGPTADGVIGLKNGCICCSLQGDLLRTLKRVLPSAPELIVIEASGVADPAGIIQSLMDPVLRQAARLQTVACTVDAADAAERASDPLWQAQLRGSDLLILTKTDVIPGTALAALRPRLAAEHRKPLFDLTEDLPISLLLDQGGATPRASAAPSLPDSRFVTLEWAHDGAIDLAAFQTVMEQVAPELLRAKGFLRVTGHEDTLLFQLSGTRATLERAPAPAAPCCQLVLIGARDVFDRDRAAGLLARLEG